MTTKIYNKKIYAVLLLAFMLLELIFSAFSITASAEVITYSDVLYDLQKDENFNIENYPVMTYDYFSSLNSDSDPTNDVEYLSVIHIAEGENKELFVYTYQPLNNVSDITASSITMSVGEDSEAYEKYNLKCVSFNGSFKKYQVYNADGSVFTIPNTQYRYYNLVEIERPFDTLLDEKISNETITDYKAHTVAQTWCCYYLNNKLVYEATSLEVVEITPTLTDFIYLADGITWGSIVGLNSGGHAHYIAFNIDNYDADKIIDADITYKSVPYNSSTLVTYILGIESDRSTTTQYKNLSGEWVTTLDDSVWKPNEFTITEDQKRKYEGDGLWAREYKWDRIMTASSFVTNMENQGVTFSTSVKNTLNNSQFVFAFEETEYSSIYTPVYAENGMILSETYYSEGTKVAQVDIIRLKFMVGETTYNLGVVGDVTSADDIPGGVGSGLDIEFKDLEDTLQMLFALICFVIFLLILSFFVGPLKVFFSVIWKGIKFIFEMIWAIVSLPIQLIQQAFSGSKLKRKRKRR